MLPVFICYYSLKYLCLPKKSTGKKEENNTNIESLEENDIGNEATERNIFERVDDVSENFINHHEMMEENQ